MGCNIYTNTCVLCRSNYRRIARVCIQNNFQLLKRNLQQEFQKYNPYSYLLMCEICLMKLKIFIKCDSKTYTPDFSKRMQESSHTKEDNYEEFQDTSCQCEHCKAKYGNLPLLAEVIEKIENRSTSSHFSKQDIAKKSENVQDHQDQIEALKETETEVQDIPINFSVRNNIQSDTDCPQPSTSKESVVNRKIMNCEHCGKSFTHKGDLNKHLRKHTGEQPFQCPVCDRKFAHTSNLARHLRLHSGDKPFQCERCNKSFSRKDKLIIHQKTRLCLNSPQSSKS